MGNLKWYKYNNTRDYTSLNGVYSIENWVPREKTCYLWLWWRRVKPNISVRISEYHTNSMLWLPKENWITRELDVKRQHLSPKEFLYTKPTTSTQISKLDSTFKLALNIKKASLVVIELVTAKNDGGVSNRVREDLFDYFAKEFSHWNQRPVFWCLYIASSTCTNNHHSTIMWNEIWGLSRRSLEIMFLYEKWLIIIFKNWCYIAVTTHEESLKLLYYFL